MTPVFLLLLACAQNADRQDPVRPKGVPSRPGAWTLDGRAEAGITYDTNVWLLDGGQQDRLEEDRPADQISGRYDNMESVDDFIFTPDLRLEARGPSPLGRRMDAYLDLEYPFYSSNPHRSHLELGLGVVQDIGPRGNLEFSLKFMPDYFKKNYLADGVDANGNGNISADERRYDDGTYREGELELEYRHKLVDRDAQHPFGLFGDVALGLRERAYDSPFDNRDEDAWFARLGLRFAYGPKLRWGIHYRYESIDAPGDSEVVLVDEVALGQDVNGDAILANNGRVVTPVDRSKAEQTIGLSLGYALTSALEAEIAYSRLFRDYSSNEPLDFAHTDREDSRDEVEMGLKFFLTKNWDTRVGWQWREQHTDRPDDPGGSGETVDYKRHLFLISAVYHW